MRVKKAQEFQESLRNLLTWFLSPKSLGLNDNRNISVNTVARHICHSYSLLQFPAKRPPRAALDIKPFHKDDYLGKDNAYLSPVIEMYHFARERLFTLLDAFILHGSLSTLDYSKGWSDFDTYLIVSKATLEDTELLCRLREALLAAYDILLKISPLQHHGFLLCSTHDLEYYPEHFMPAAVLKEGKNFWKANVKIRPYLDRERYKNDFFKHVKFMRNSANSDEFPHHAYNGVYLQGHFRNASNAMYQLQNFLEFISIIPCYYLMAKEEPCYKRDSFARVEALAGDRWNIIERIIRIREEWEKREPHPYPSNAVPRWLQETLGDDYLEGGALFVEKLGESLGIQTLNRSDHSYFFSGFPKIKNTRHYTDARNELIDHYRNIPDVVALYEYGTCSNPGISDLDVIAVLSDEPVSASLEDELYVTDPTENLHELLDGMRIKAVAESHFQQIQCLGLIGTHHLFGKKVSITPQPQYLEKMFLMCDVMDWLPERIMTLLSISISRDITVTEILGHLKSFTITLNRMEDIGFHLSGPMRELISNINGLRKKWIKFPDRVNLMDTTEKTITHGFPLMGEFASFVESNGFIKKPVGKIESLFYLRPGRGYKFRPTQACTNRPFKHIGRDGNIIIDVPQIWLSYILTIARHQGSLSELISGNIENSPLIHSIQMSEDLSRAVSYRMDLCNAMYVYFDKFNIPKTLLYRFGHIRSIK